MFAVLDKEAPGGSRWDMGGERQPEDQGRGCSGPPGAGQQVSQGR